MHPNPYAADLGDLDPLEALATTPEAIRSLVEAWHDDVFERSYAPGKWSARLLLVHLAQTETALGMRVRFALTTPAYRAQSFDQDAFVPLDQRLDARTALDVYLSMRQMNLAMWRGLSEEQKRQPFHHPEYGQLEVFWVAAQLAGHDLHHLEHFQRIAAGAAAGRA